MAPSLNVCFACLLVSAEPGTSVDTQAGSYREPEAYRVYESILQENPAFTQAESALIRATTVTYSPACLAPGATYRADVNAAVTDYKRRNRKSAQLQAQFFHLKRPFEVVPESDFLERPTRLKNSSRWHQYLLGHRGFPGFIELSQVGFNAAMTMAVVYMVHNCGAMCSGGDLIVLEKHQGEWRPLNLTGLRCYWKS